MNEKAAKELLEFLRAWMPKNAGDFLYDEEKEPCTNIRESLAAAYEWFADK